MKVNFLGLYGATGIMPHFDTQRLINTGPRENVEKAFLDLFNHRAISLFYRIWEKHRFYIGYERVRSVQRDEGAPLDSFTEQLQSVLGLGTRAVQNRLAIRDESLLYYAGHFSRGARCAVSLERILNDYFSFACEVLQFVGQWLELDPSNRSEMPTAERPLGINCTLGQAFILGERVWSRDGKFRLRLGPLSQQEFDRILTQGDEVRALSQVTRMYVGLQYDFDVQLVLDRTDVPKMKMDQPDSLRLGKNTWLITREPQDHVDDCIMEVDGYPES
jgi:type VI secretion system protein ImpH